MKLHPILLIFVSLWMIIALAGCGGSENIPPASILASGRVTLSWNPVPGAASYTVYLGTTPGITALNSYKISGVSNPITIRDLEPGTTYYFVLAVEDDSGTTRRSSEVSYTVTDAGGLIEFGDILSQLKPEEKSGASQATPATKTPVTRSEEKSTVPARVPVRSTPLAKSADQPAAETRPVEAAGSSDVTLAWDDVPNATSYNIYWSDKPGVNRQNGTKISNVRNPYKLKGLKKGKKYYFVVTAVNASGESNPSDEFSFVVGQ